MKKKLFLIIICLTMLLVGCDKKESSYKVTLDINPSIEIEVQNDKVKKITALNDEAEEIVNHKMEGRLLESAFEDILKKAKEKDLMDGEVLNIVFGVDNSSSDAEDQLRDASKDTKIRINIIVPDITDEAKKKAEEHKITSAKAAFILGIIRFNENLKFDDLLEKSIRELSEMKQTGLYCDEGYTLRSGYCEKVIKEEEPQEAGNTCPEGYQKVKDNCYYVATTKHEPSCKDGAELKDGKCIGTERVEASVHCSGNGSYNKNTGECEELVFRGVGNISTDSEGVTTTTCPSGSNLTTGNKGKGCYEYRKSAPSYTCSKGTLDGTECIVETGAKEPTLKVVCDKGLTKYKDISCLDYKKKADYVKGLTCKGNARLENDRCVYYETIAPKGK